MQVACLHPGPTNIDPPPHERTNSVMAGLFMAIKKPAGFDLTSWIFVPDRPLSLQEIMDVPKANSDNSLRRGAAWLNPVKM